MSQAGSSSRVEARELSLGPFIHPTTYRVIAAAHSWFDDLLIVVVGTAAITLLELLFNHVRISMSLRDETGGIDHLALVLQAQIWYPAVATGIAMLACLRLRAHLGPNPSARRVLAFGLAGVVAGAVPALAETSAPWWRVTPTAAPSVLPPGGFGQIVVTAANLGDGEANGSSSPITLTETLPAGVVAVGISGGVGPAGNFGGGECSLEKLSCTKAVVHI